ncbi:hypothetical protein GE09DRAFT_1227337 [Coniochaeta sp. 2T2.1]|nr:hypothetical protein GE09DRAFT_1227337 [Coniochaeta sp. 2T2.1]
MCGSRQRRNGCDSELGKCQGLVDSKALTDGEPPQVTSGKNKPPPRTFDSSYPTALRRPFSIILSSPDDCDALYDQIQPTLARIYRFFINFCDFEGFSTTITDDDHARQRPPPRRAHHRLRRTRTTGPASPTRPAEKKRLPEDELLHGTAPRGNVTPIGEEGAPPPASRPRRERAAYGAAHQRRRTTPPREPPRTGAPPRKPDKPSLPPRPRVPTRLPHTHYKGKPTTPSSGRTFTRQETEVRRRDGRGGFASAATRSAPRRRPSLLDGVAVL